MIGNLLTLPCTIVRRGLSTEEEFGKKSRPESYIETVCEIQQQSRQEGAGELSITGWIGFFPAGTALDANDEVLTDELGEFEVIAVPARLRNPRTTLQHHVEATLRQTTGPGGS